MCLFICVNTLPQQNNAYNFNQNAFNRPQNQQLLPQQNYQQQIQPQQQQQQVYYIQIIWTVFFFSEIPFDFFSAENVRNDLSFGGILLF